MSKRKVTDEDVTYITTPTASISAEQHAALQDVRMTLPLDLECLAPILEGLLEAYDDVVPPHKRPIKVGYLSLFLHHLIATY